MYRNGPLSKNYVPKVLCTDMDLPLILLILLKTDLMHIGNIEIFYFIIKQPIPEPEIRD